MNAERLIEVLKKLSAALVATEVDTRLQQIESNLQQVISQPTAVQFQTQLMESIQGLKLLLSAAAESDSGPVWTKSVQELQLAELLPSLLVERLDEVFQGSQITPAVSLQEIQALRQSVVSGNARIAQVIEGLESFGIREYDIPPTKAEIGVLIPRSAIDNNLDQFGKEARLINRLIDHMSEAVTGTTENIQIQSVSTSDILIYVLVAPKIAWAFAASLSAIVVCYEKILRIRALNEQLRAEGVSESQLDGPKKFANDEMQKAIDNSVKQIITTSKQGKERNNELKKLLDKALWDLAKRLDEGYNFDVRASEKTDDSISEDDRNAAVTIKALRKSLDFLNVSGEPILQLPPGLSDLPEDHLSGASPDASA